MENIISFVYQNDELSNVAFISDYFLAFYDYLLELFQRTTPDDQTISQTFKEVLQNLISDQFSPH